MNTRFFKHAVIFGFIGAIALFLKIIYYSVFDLSQGNFFYIRNEDEFIPKLICIFIIFAFIFYLLYTMSRIPREFKCDNYKSLRNVISAHEYLLVTISVATAFFTLISAHSASKILFSLAVTAVVAFVCLLFHKATKKSIGNIMSSGNNRRIHPLFSLIFIIIFVISLSTIANCIVGLCSSSTVFLFTDLFPYLTKTSLTIFEIGVQLPIIISSLLFIIAIHGFKRSSIIERSEI